MYYFQNPNIEKRVITEANHQYAITNYGLDNLYPQRMDELYKRSPLTKQAIKVLAEFCIGEGWTSQGDKVVNELGQTFNDILRLVSEDLNTFNGFSLHLNFNAVGRVVEIQHIPFEYVRLGIKGIDGRTDHCMVFNNWEEDGTKFKQYEGLKPQRFQLFNPKIAAENALLGSNGQVLYWTPHMWQYPECTFDAIRDTVQTDYEIQIFSLKSIQNGFLGTTVFKYPGGFDSDEERSRVTFKLKDLTGSHNANAPIIAETPEDFNGTLIENVPANNNDRLFEQTGNKAVNTILQNFGVPGPLLAVNPQGSVFTQEQIRDSYILMNLRTRNKRLLLERIFTPIAKLFGVRLGSIKEIPFEIPGMNMPKLNGDPNQLQEEEPKKEQEEEPKEEARTKLIKIYG